MGFIVPICLGFIAYTVLTLVMERVFESSIVVSERLDDIIKKDDETEEGRESISIGQRVLNPIIDRIVDLLVLILPKRLLDNSSLNEQLLLAGMKVTPEYYSANVLFTTLSIGVIVELSAFVFERSLLDMLPYSIFGMLAGLVLARFDLKSKITRRKREIYHQMPEVMDLLSVSVAAGLGFDQALSYVVEKAKGPLIDELAIAQRELMLGKLRKDALNDLASRCDSTELKTFVVAVLQADEMGSSLQNVLQIQADSIRLAHKQAVEEEANKLPIKIILPLALFIMPTLFIIILGPAGIAIYETMM